MVTMIAMVRSMGSYVRLLLCAGACVILWSPSPAHAIPIAGDYAFTSGLVGTFTSDGSSLSQWAFHFPTFPTAVFEPTAPGFILFNDSLDFAQAILPSSGPIFAAVTLNWGNADYVGDVDAQPLFGEFQFAPTGGQVPIPETASLFLLLLGLGLVALVNYGWWRRQGGMQVG